MTSDETSDKKITGSDNGQNYEIFSVDRDTMGYRDNKGTAMIGVDRGFVYELFPEDLAWRSSDGVEEPMTDDERSVVLQRIRTGLHGWGIQSRDVHDRPVRSGQQMIDDDFFDRPPGVLRRLLRRWSSR